MRKTEFIANFISFFYFDFYYFLHCYYYHHHINITSCSKISFWIFHLFPLLASVYPTIFKEPQWKQLLCYPCHRNSFTAFLTISSVLIKLLLFSSNYANFFCSVLFFVVVKDTYENTCIKFIFINFQFCLFIWALRNMKFSFRLMEIPEILESKVKSLLCFPTLTSSSTTGA